jgi:hypothetical protein
MENIFIEGWYLVLRENSIEARLLSSYHDLNENEIIVSQVYENFEEAKKIQDYANLENKEASIGRSLSLAPDCGCVQTCLPATPELAYPNGAWQITSSTCGVLEGCGPTCAGELEPCQSGQLNSTRNVPCTGCGTCGVICTGGIWY